MQTLKVAGLEDALLYSGRSYVARSAQKKALSDSSARLRPLSAFLFSFQLSQMKKPQSASRPGHALLRVHSLGRVMISLLVPSVKKALLVPLLLSLSI